MKRLILVVASILFLTGCDAILGVKPEDREPQVYCSRATWRINPAVAVEYGIPPDTVIVTDICISDNAKLGNANSK